MSDTFNGISGTLRLFIALPLPRDLKKDLKRLARHEIRGVRWARADQLHITLHFLGDTKASLIPRLLDELAQIKVECFNLTINDCGFFPGYKQPRVFWLDFQESPALKQLHQQVLDGLANLDIPTESRPFVPHLTMARLNKDYQSRRSNAHIFELAEPFMDHSFEVDSFHLFSSDLQEGGTQYTSVRAFPCFNA